MRKTLKKVVVSVMAAASLTISVTGFNASAISDNTVYLPYSLGKGYFYVSTNSMYGYTQAYEYQHTIDISLYDYSPHNGCTVSVSGVESNKRTMSVSGGTFSWGEALHTISTSSRTNKVWST